MYDICILNQRVLNQKLKGDVKNGKGNSNNNN